MPLIGPDQFPACIRLPMILAATVLPAIGTAVMPGTFPADGDAGEIIGGGIIAAIGVAMHIFFRTTPIFAIIERGPGSRQTRAKWDPSTLPDTPPGGVRRGDTLAAVHVARLGVPCLPWQHSSSPFTGGVGGESIPTLNAEPWPVWIPLLMAGLPATAVLEISRYRADGRSWRFVANSTVLELVVAVPLIRLAAATMLLAPRDVTGVPGHGWVDAALHLNVPAILITAGVLPWNLVDPLPKVRIDTAARAKHGDYFC
ncbi:hypothetical protein DQ353_06825 [Arthrobacter sp. AQ5-05]|uniref:hypothetical protein n=1 Tax=Arthrobacter sp. AQ5-05 TaxID=2184581 RepID=UPI000DCD2B87|nr:hypothetical protein [Arthrobacter sp. AQ5-05]RAX49874.1 hypothetical protein DQ353_06825 [Arthrobacter sp. AQ5-05]